MSNERKERDQNALVSATGSGVVQAIPWSWPCTPQALVQPAWQEAATLAAARCPGLGSAFTGDQGGDAGGTVGERRE